MISIPINNPDGIIIYTIRFTPLSSRAPRYLVQSRYFLINQPMTVDFGYYFYFSNAALN